MKFDSKSVLLNDGVNIILSIALPDVIKKSYISTRVWQRSIANFNERLNERKGVTETINGNSVDVLRLESFPDCPDSPIGLLVVANKEDLDSLKVADFGITGELEFKGNSWEEVQFVNISDIVYTNVFLQRCHLLKKC